MARTTQKQKLTVVIDAIEAAGYNSYAQLTGYASTGNPAYITRQGGARALVQEVSGTTIRRYLADCAEMRSM